jgi:hypothetical protein
LGITANAFLFGIPAWAERGRSDAAIPLLTSALQLAKSESAPNATLLAGVNNNLGVAETAAGNPEKAEESCCQRIATASKCKREPQLSISTNPPFFTTSLSGLNPGKAALTICKP